jgi:hypothetical protein
MTTDVMLPPPIASSVSTRSDRLSFVLGTSPTALVLPDSLMSRRELDTPCTPIVSRIQHISLHASKPTSLPLPESRPNLQTKPNVIKCMS